VSDDDSNLNLSASQNPSAGPKNSWGGFRLGAGRRTVLTQEVADEILANIRRCGRIQMSVEASCVAWKTYQHWSLENREPWSSFIEACWAAKRDFQAGLVESLAKEAQWAARAWVLERDGEDGHTFARPAQVHVHDHNHTIRQPLPVDSKPVLDAEARVMGLLQEGGSDGQG
jgi:hypothetical protein